MQIQNIGLIQSFKGTKTFEQKKKELERKIIELQDINDELNSELEQKLEYAKAAEIKYIVTRANRNRLNGELAEIRSRVYDNLEELSAMQNQYRSMMKNEADSNKTVEIFG